MGFEIEPKGQGWGPLGCSGAAVSSQAPVIGHLWRPTLPISSLGPSQEDEERYTLRILTLVSLKGFLMDGLSWRDCRVGEKKRLCRSMVRWSVSVGVLTPISSVGVLSHVQLFATPWTAAHQAPVSVGFSRQADWSRLPSPPPGDLPDPEIKTVFCVSCIGRWILHLFTTAPPRGSPRLQQCRGNYASP